MLEKLKQSWRDLKESPPGSASSTASVGCYWSPRSSLNKALSIVGGIVLMVTGLFLVPAPGPFEIIAFIGAGLIAQESFIVARVLDWLVTGTTSAITALSTP